MMGVIRRMVAPSLLSRWRPPLRVAQPAIDLDLPRAVLEALDRAMVKRRPCMDEEKERRVLVTLPGGMPWYQGQESNRKAIACRFPDLNQQQLDDACARLQSNINAELRALRRLERGPNWATNW